MNQLIRSLPRGFELLRQRFAWAVVMQPKNEEGKVFGASCADVANSV